MTHPDPAVRAFELLTRRIADLESSGWRLARFSPPASLPLAELWLPDRESCVAAEVLDLSGGGIRLAVHQGIAVPPGSPCRVVVTLESGDSHPLPGRILRVESLPLISMVVVVPRAGGSASGDLAENG